MKYLIDGEKFTDVSAAAEYISDWIDESEYDDMLDDCCEGVMGFDPSTILFECDPIAYDMGFDEYKNSIQEDIEYTIERMGDGDTNSWYGWDVEAIDDEEEEDDE